MKDIDIFVKDIFRSCEGGAQRLVITAVVLVWEAKMCWVVEILMLRENCVAIFWWCIEPIYQKAFNDVKAVIVKHVTLAYPEYSKAFEIYSNASSQQMGAVITQ